jgi:hypothetical protein
VARVFLDLSAWGRAPEVTRRSTARWFWTIGCALYLLHVAAAFAFFHDWSHTAAYRHTAEQTAHVTGLEWGGGLYVNYAFTLFWLVDTACWWLVGIDWPYRSRAYFVALQGVFAFLMFNATVVFGPPYWRWIGLVVVAAAVALVARNRGRNTPVQ